MRGEHENTAYFDALHAYVFSDPQRIILVNSVFCQGFQKGRVPSEKGTFSAVSGPSKGHN